MLLESIDLIGVLSLSFLFSNQMVSPEIFRPPGSQIFQSSVFSCIVSISRRDILRSRLVTLIEMAMSGCLQLG